MQITSRKYLLGQAHRNYKSTDITKLPDNSEKALSPAITTANTAQTAQSVNPEAEVAVSKSAILDIVDQQSMDIALELNQDEFDDLEYTVDVSCTNDLHRCINQCQLKLSNILPLIKYVLAGLLVIGYFAYFGYAMHCSFGDEGSIRLLCLTCVLVLLFVAHVFNRLWGQKFYDSVLDPLNLLINRFFILHGTALSIVGTIAFFIYFLGLIIGIGSRNFGNLISGIGIVVIVLFALVLSSHPTRVNWRPVMCGLAIQISLAALVLRTQAGLNAFRFLGDRIAEFKAHVDAGVVFVLGTDFRDHFFAFAVLPVIVFFSSFIALLFHLGILQTIIEKLGWLMQMTMGTTSGESLVAAAETFVGQGPLLIRPFLGRLTNSELYAVITAEFATIPVGTLAAYISLGVPAVHLISASVLMSPGALALAKIMYPETKKSKTDNNAIRKVKITRYRNVIDAVGSGAINSIRLVTAVAVNLIAFISMLTFLNNTLTWLGHRACLQVDLTFELICAYLFWPVAYIIGVSFIDCSRVAELIGIKFFINEFVAYQRFTAPRINVASPRNRAPRP